MSTTKRPHVPDGSSPYPKKQDIDISSLSDEFDDSVSSATLFLQNCSDSAAKAIIEKLLSTCQKQHFVIDSLTSSTAKLSNRIDALENYKNNCSIIVSGLKVMGDSPSSISINDQKACNAMLNCIGVDVAPPTIYRLPSRSTQQPAGVRRSQTPVRPPLLKMVFPEPFFQRKVLAKARTLRSHSKFDGVFINPLRTPDQHKLFLEKRKTITTLRQANISAVYYKNDIYLKADDGSLKLYIPDAQNNE